MRVTISNQTLEEHRIIWPELNIFTEAEELQCLFSTTRGDEAKAAISGLPKGQKLDPHQSNFTQVFLTMLEWVNGERGEKLKQTKEISEINFYFQMEPICKTLYMTVI